MVLASSDRIFFLFLVLLADTLCCSASHGPAGGRQCLHHLSECSGGTPVCVRSSSALVTLLLPTSEFLGSYLEGTVKLAQSAAEHSTAGRFDLVLLQLDSQPLPQSWHRELITAGWQICTVKPIDPPEPDLVFPRFRDQFVKLRLWGFVEYDRIVYMDSDCFVVGNIDPLFDDSLIDLGPTSFAATRDIFDGHWMAGFNMGVFALRPSEAEHKRLLAAESGSAALDYKKSQAEQGLLNNLYENKWVELPAMYGANLAIYKQKPDEWKGIEHDLRVIHYTLVKPWRCEREFTSICELWTSFEPTHHGKMLSVCAEQVRVRSEQALFTLALPDNPLYLQGTLKLGISATEHSTVGFDLVALQLASQPLQKGQIAALEAAGFQVCTVPPIVPPQVELVHHRFRDQFGKLHIWKMEEYARAVYMDSDCLVVGDIDPLFTHDITPFHFAAAFDQEPSGQRATFNMGVFVVEPNRAQFDHLMFLLHSDKLDYERIMAEQGFLNAVFSNQWFTLPFIFNANIARVGQEVWTSQEQDIRVIHYTTKKPWDCNEAVCKPWQDLDTSQFFVDRENTDVQPAAEDHESNHSFAILAFLAIVGVLCWWLCSRRKQKKTAGHGIHDRV